MKAKSSFPGSSVEAGIQTGVPGFRSEARRPLRSNGRSGVGRRTQPRCTHFPACDRLRCPTSPQAATHRASNCSVVSLQTKSCRVLRMGSVTPLQVVAVAEKGRGDSLVHEKEKGEQSVYIKVGKPHKVDFTTGTKVKQNEKSGHFN